MSAGPHILIVQSPYYEEIAGELLRGAVAELAREGATHNLITVPGALEIPAAIAISSTGATQYDGYIAVGCVIRGETSHYDIVAGQSARALMDLGVVRGLAIGNAILTVDTADQARARAAVEGKNKGADAARACLALVALKRSAQG